MSKQKNLAPLFIGLILVLVGGLFLAVNVLDFSFLRFLRLDGFRFVLPILFTLWGVIKLVRHFSWGAEQIQSRPARSSLLSGLFWTSVGTVWFLALLGILKFLEFFGLYWPLILVFFGLGKILDYYRFQGRIRLRAGEVLGVLLIIFLGFTVGRVAEANFEGLNFDFPAIEVGDRDIRIRSTWGETFRWSDEVREPSEGIAQLEIDNSYGDIRIEAGTSSAIEITLSKEIVAKDRAEAQKIADRIQVEKSREGEVLRVGTNREEVRSTQQRVSTNLSLRVPARMMTRLKGRHGNVKVSGLENELSVENSSGDVDVSSQTGTLKIVNEYGNILVKRVQGVTTLENRRGRVSLEDVTGDVQVKTLYDSAVVTNLTGNLVLQNRFGSVRIRGVSGTVDVDAPGSSVSVRDTQQLVKIQNSQKSVEIRQSRGPVDLETSYSRAELMEIQGTVELRATHSEITAKGMESKFTCKAVGSKLALSELSGGFDLVTTLRPITVDGFRGVGVAQNEFDDIRISTGENLTEDLSISNKNGDIDLRLPPDAAFILSAQAPGGRIRSDFDSLKAEEGPESEGSPLMETTIGNGGARVRLQTSQGEIRIRRNGRSPR